MKGRRLIAMLLLAAALTAWMTQTAAARRAPGRASRSGPHYLLALGDSLAVGYQPNRAGVGVETNQGYANDLFTVLRRHVKNLKLVELGCPGDTTTSLLTGRGNLAAARYFHCDRSGGSQLRAAERFLRAHHARGEVSLITLDIGANDVDGCTASAGAGFAAVAACVARGVSQLEKNTPKILAGLERAAAARTPMAAMNLYDPILAGELSSDPNQQTLGRVSLSLVRTVNAAIAKADSAHRFRTADVADAFGTYDTKPVSTAGTPGAGPPTTTVPTDVANICALTWMCAPAPVGPNIHANRAGYARIAGAFEKVLGKLL